VNNLSHKRIITMQGGKIGSHSMMGFLNSRAGGETPTDRM
jgi:hypothetical protein